MLQLAHAYHLVTHSPWPLLLSLSLANFSLSSPEIFPWSFLIAPFLGGIAYLILEVSHLADQKKTQKLWACKLVWLHLLVIKQGIWNLFHNLFEREQKQKRPFSLVFILTP